MPIAGAEGLRRGEGPDRHGREGGRSGRGEARQPGQGLGDAATVAFVDAEGEAFGVEAAGGGGIAPVAGDLGEVGEREGGAARVAELAPEDERFLVVGRCPVAVALAIGDDAQVVEGHRRPGLVAELAPGRIGLGVEILRPARSPWRRATSPRLFRVAARSCGSPRPRKMARASSCKEVACS